MSPAKILVVDDDKNLLELVRMRLESSNYEVVTALKEEDAVEAVKKQVFDLSIIDLQLIHRDGISLMQELHLINPDMPVIILTAHGTIESAVEAMTRGAYNYLTKPFDPRGLLMQVQRALEKHNLASEIKRLKGLLQEQYSFANIVAKSEKMQQVLDLVSRIARTESTVFIDGESGTGKELIAKAVHLASDRKDRSFVAINCAALPETLLESELFGHEKGAFTGAVRSTKGLLTQANGGTLFLDEIGDMPTSIQAKVLRVLQERQFYPVGSEKPAEVDVRFIVATKQNLNEEVKKGLFREDLFYRIHVIPIHLPPLRERKEDVPHLVEHFLKRFSEQMKKEIRGVAPSAMQKLMLHDWPGNVRELENIIEYAVAMTRRDVIGDELILQSRLDAQTGRPINLQDDPLMSQEHLRPLKEARDSFEKNYLIQLLERSEGNVSQASKLAGKYRADFYDLLKKHGLKIEDFKKAKPDTKV